MTAIIKSVLLVVLFGATLLGALVAIILYSIVLTSLLCLGLVLFLWLVAKGMMFVGLLPTTYSLPPVEIFGVIGLVINFLMIGLLLLGTALTFMACPSKVKQAAMELDALEAAEPWVSIRSAMHDVSDKLGANVFTHVVATRDGHIGCIRLGDTTILCIDPDLSRWLEPEELRGVIAHEFGHFVGNTSFAYDFIRRCVVSKNFLEYEVQDGGPGTAYLTLIRGVSHLMPGFMKGPLLWAYVHMARMVVRFYVLATRIATRAFSREFYRAEFLADQTAFTCYRKAFVAGLGKVAMLAFIVSQRKQSGAIDQATLWPLYVTFSSRGFVTHPPLSLRRARLGVGVVESEERVTFSRLAAQASGSAQEPELLPAAEFLQELSHSQVASRQLPDWRRPANWRLTTAIALGTVSAVGVAAWTIVSPLMARCDVIDPTSVVYRHQNCPAPAPVQAAYESVGFDSRDWGSATNENQAALGLAFSSDGTRLAVQTTQKSIIAVDTTSFRSAVFSVVGDGESLLDDSPFATTLAYVPGTQTIIAGREDGETAAFDDASGRKMPLLPQTGLSWKKQLAVSPDARWLAALGGSSVQLWPSPKAGVWVDAQPTEVKFQVSMFVDGMEFSPNSKFLALYGGGGAVRVISLPSLAECEIQYGRVIGALAFSADSKSLAFSGLGEEIYLYDTACKSIATLVQHDGKRIIGMATSPDGELLAVQRFDMSVVVWDVRSRDWLSELRPRGRQGMGPDLRFSKNVIAFSPRGDSLAALGMPGTVVLWNTANARDMGHKDGGKRYAPREFKLPTGK